MSMTRTPSGSRLSVSALLAAALCGIAPLAAQDALHHIAIPDEPAAHAAAQTFRTSSQVPAATDVAVEKVLNLSWSKSIKAALKQAKIEGKPVFVVQALGELKGFT